MKPRPDFLRAGVKRDSTAIPNALLLALSAALTLMSLRFLAGSFDHLIFWRLVFTQDISAAWLGTALVVLAWIGARFWRPTGAGASFERLAGFVDNHTAALSLATFPFYGVLAFFVARGRAFAADEASILFQSQVFALGQLTATVPPDLIDWLVPADFQGHFLHVSQESGAMVSSFWPGYALLLTPFSWLGVPYLCNPFLTSLSLWAIHRLARQLGGSPIAALWATLFTLASPVIALNAASYFSMPAHLLFNALFCLLLARQSSSAALWAGVVGGFALLLHNPVPHATFSLPWLIWLAWRRRDLLWRALCGYFLIGFPLLLTWSLFLNSFDASYHVLAYEARGAAGGPLVDIQARLRVAFAPPRLSVWIARMAGMSKMAVWAVPALPIFAWGGAQLVRDNRWSRLLIASFWVTFIGYLFVRFDQGAGWGFRYMHSVWLALPILAGIFLARKNPISGGVSLRHFAAWCLLLSTLVLLPFQAWQVSDFLNRQFAQVPSAGKGVSLTFINTKNGDYSDSLIRNDAFLRAPGWKLVGRSASANAELARRILIEPRLEKGGEWGEIWLGDGFTPRYSRSKLD